jgi:hypothetical protein
MSSRLREHLLSALAVPLAHAAVTTELVAASEPEHTDALLEWLYAIEQLGAPLEFSRPRNQPQTGLRIEVKTPRRAAVHFQLCYASAARTTPEAELRAMRARSQDDLIVIVLCMDATDTAATAMTESYLTAARSVDNDRFLVMEPRWAAAILLERASPLLPGNLDAAGRHPATTYISLPAQATSGSVRVRRTDAATALALVDTGLFRDRLAELQNLPDVQEPIYLCTNFLPPVTHSQKAVQRFYEHEGASRTTLALVADRSAYDRDVWLRHIRNHRRIDVVDRRQLEEYLAAPEYYQMPLRPTELTQQIGTLIELLEYDNYTLCLTPQAVDIPFELRGTEVHIRGDRRNRGPARPGRVTSLVIREAAIRNAFEREFYAALRLTEPPFLDKNVIAAWLKERVRRYRQIDKERRATTTAFDVFLCHNSEDKRSIRQIARALQSRGVQPWFDEWHAPPGTRWIWELERQLNSVRSAAIFIGESGLGPWQRQEMEGLLVRLNREETPLIPVILRNGAEPTALPLFLEGLGYVDMRKRSASDKLAEAIRKANGTKPASRRRERRTPNRR